MERESVLDYFWQEFAAVEWSTDMTLGDMFDVSLWVHKLCGSLCDLFLASASARPSQYDLNTEAANILGYIFNIYCEGYRRPGSKQRFFFFIIRYEK